MMTNFRSISVLPAFSKILEKVFIYDQLVSHLLNFDLMFDFHHTLCKMFSYMLLTAGVELLMMQSLF